MTERYVFIEEHRSEFPVKIMCETLEVSRSGFYDSCKRERSEHSKDDERLSHKIEKLFIESKQTYGVRRIVKALDETCSKHRAARLMREKGLVAKKRRRWKWRYRKVEHPNVSPNLLQRDFSVSEPNKVWVGDIKYIWTAEGWLYLATVIDLFSRMVIGWEMSAKTDAKLVCRALVMAHSERQPEGKVVFHSDQGCQYTSHLFQEQLKQLDMTGSMSGRGQCLDNAVAESFFSSLDTELLWNNPLKSRAEGRLDVFKYIEVFYNRSRLHSSLGYVSPRQFEQSHEEAKVQSSSPTIIADTPTGTVMGAKEFGRVQSSEPGVFARRFKVALDCFGSFS